MPFLQRSRALLTIPMRDALALAFLSSVRDRCGLLGPPGTPGLAWGNLVRIVRDDAAAKSMLQTNESRFWRSFQNLNRTLLRVRWEAGGDYVIFRGCGRKILSAVWFALSRREFSENRIEILGGTLHPKNRETEWLLKN
jgi:hypothetical protein